MIEKEFFSGKRFEQLKYWPELAELEKWGKYCLIPLDIPRFEYPALVEWFFHESKPTYKIKDDIAYKGTGQTAFDSIDVISDNNLDQEDVWSLNLKQEFMTDFRCVYDRILADFPFKSLSRIRMWSSTKDIMYHRDHTKFIDFPGAFRIMLYDQNHYQTLSLIESLPDTKGNIYNRFPIPRMLDTNSFVWNNLRTKHGSKFIPGFRKIVIILDRYEIDIERYNTLIEKSVVKYKKNCLISQKSKNEYLL
jgi:hypothetical protein